MSECIKHPEPVIYCSDCANLVLQHATANPGQTAVSVYCEHGKALLTVQIGNVKGERMVYLWSASGPMSEEQAYAAVADLAEVHGLTPVVNAGSQRVN